MATDDRGRAILVAYWTPFAFALILIGARLVSRIWFVHFVGLDDWAAILAMSTAFGSSILSTLGVYQGLGRHIWTLSPDQQLTAVIYTWAAQTLSLLTFAIGKVSIALFLLLRVIGVTKNVWTKVFLYSVITSLLAINSATIIMVYAQCRPVQKLFNPDYPGHCFSAKITTGFARFGGVWSAITDVGLAAFAVWTVWKLHIGWQKKFRLSCLLGLGIFAGGCALVKVYYLQQHDGRAVNDFTYGQTELIIWTALEQYSIIIGACAPCVQPVAVALLRKAGLGSPSQSKKTHYPLEALGPKASLSWARSKRNTPGSWADEESPPHREGTTSSKEDMLPSPRMAITKTVDLDVEFDGRHAEQERSWTVCGNGEERAVPRDVLRC